MSIIHRLRYVIKDRFGARAVRNHVTVPEDRSTPTLTSAEPYRGDWDAERTLGGRTPAEFWETLSSRHINDWTYSELSAYYHCLSQQLAADHIETASRWALLEPIEDELTLRRQVRRTELNDRSTTDLEAERDALAGVRLSSLNRKQLAELFHEIGYTQEEVNERLEQEDINIDKELRHRHITNYLLFDRYNAERLAEEQAREAAKSPAERLADELYDELMHAYTLENTPISHINGGSDEPDAEHTFIDVDTEGPEEALDTHLHAHPELVSVKKFAAWYRNTDSIGLS